jgi:G3E family GTPase
MTEAPHTPVIVDVLTGFLGAGKTTLIRRLAEAGALAGTAVLVNEFADLPVDQRLMKLSGLRAEVFADACLCCVVDGDLRASLLMLLESRANGDVSFFSRILIETSGIADPTPLLAALAADPMLRPRLRLGHVVTLVDCCHAAATIADQEEALAQIVAADAVMLTKTDLADGSQVAATLHAIGTFNPLAELLTADASDIGFDPFGEIRRRSPASPSKWREPAETFHAAAHRHAVAATVLKWPSSIDWAVFASWLSLLLHRHGNSILRMKGMLTVRGEEHHGPVVIQSVRHIVHMPEHMPEGALDGGAEIVVIARGMDMALIRRSFEAVLRRAATNETPRTAIPMPETLARHA